MTFKLPYTEKNKSFPAHMYVPGPCVCRDGRTENRDGRTALKVMNVHIHIFKYKHAQMIKYQSINIIYLN